MLTPNVTGLQMSYIINCKRIAIPLCLSLLTACNMMEKRTGEVNLKSGDTILLNEDLTTPRGEFHIKFQHGEIKQKIRAFSNNCTIASRYKGPVTYTAGRYTVTRVQYEEEFFSDGGATVEYSTTFYIEAPDKTDKATNKRFTLKCKVLDNTMMHHNFPVPDIKQVMGDFMDFDAEVPASSAEQLPEQQEEQLPELPPDQSSSTPATASP
jgi:hypothetical protein